MAGVSGAARTGLDPLRGGLRSRRSRDLTVAAVFSETRGRDELAQTEEAAGVAQPLAPLLAEELARSLASARLISAPAACSRRHRSNQIACADGKKMLLSQHD
jgi:hypothetical protein